MVEEHEFYVSPEEYNAVIELTNKIHLAGMITMLIGFVDRHMEEQGSIDSLSHEIYTRLKAIMNDVCTESFCTFVEEQ